MPKYMELYQCFEWIWIRTLAFYSYEIARDPDILNILKKQNNVGGFILLNFKIYYIAMVIKIGSSTATAKSLQSCPTLCDPIVGSPPGSPVLGILQARTLEWVAISFSNAWKWKVKVKLLSRVWLWRPHGLQPTRLLHAWDFPGKSTGVGCHCLLQ